MARVSKSLDDWADKLQELDANKSILKAAFYEAVTGMRRRLIDILLEEIDNALGEAKEFDIPEYREPLEDVAEDPDLIVARLTETHIIIEIRMDEVAGDISDYASAVESARENYDTKEDINKASWYWAYVVYGDEELYPGTLQDRFAAMESPAPYWSLIDQGNVSGGASFSQGGVAYPQNGPTHFIDKALYGMLSELTEATNVQLRLLTEKLYEEAYGGKEVLEDVEEGVNSLDFDRASSYKPTPAIVEIERKSALYETYEAVKGAIRGLFGRSK